MESDYLSTMANPQPENGTTRINHQVLEKLLAYPFTSPVELKICLFVIRKTWGYSKKTDKISLTQFQKAIGASRPTVVHWLDSLVKHLLLVKGGQLGVREYGFNKDFDSWLVKGGQLVKVRAFTSKPPLTKTSKPPLTHNRKKENIQKKRKENIQKKRGELKSFGEEVDVVLLSEREHKKLCQKIGRRHTRAVIDEVHDWKLKNTKNMKAWTDDYRGILTWLRSPLNHGKYIPTWSDFNEDDFDSPEDYQKIITKYQ